MSEESKPRRSVSRALEILSDALEEVARRRPEVRDALGDLAHWLERLARGEVLEDRVLTPQPGRATLSRGPLHGDDGRSRDAALRQVDLALIVRRARWKADAVRFAAMRRKVIAGGEGGDGTEAVRARETELRARLAGISDCTTIWLDSPRPMPADEVLDDVAACYDFVARAAEVVEELEAVGALDPAPPSELLYLLAEGQSALLAALATTDQRLDSDQRDLFAWLKGQTTRHRIYVDRHMRLDDPAPMQGAAARLERLEGMREALLARHLRRRGRTRLLNKVRYHVTKVVEGGGVVQDSDRNAIESAASEWRALGLPPGDSSLRRLLTDFSRAPGADVPTVVRDLLQHTARTPDREDEPVARQRRADPVGELAPLVQGQAALVLAEVQDDDLERGLRETLGFETLRWVVLPLSETDAETERQLAARVEQEIRETPDGLVLLARRLPQDAYAEFKSLCMGLRRPFVRLTGTLDPPTVAHQVLRQIGWRLRG